MKHIFASATAALLITLVVAPGARALDLQDVLQMHRDGIPDSLILEKVEHGTRVFHLEAADLREMKEAGVSDRVISAMLRTEDRYSRATQYGDYYYPRPGAMGGGDYAYHGGGYVPYYGGYCAPYFGGYCAPYFGGYRYPYRAHVFLRFDFGHRRFVNRRFRRY